MIEGVDMTLKFSIRPFTLDDVDFAVKVTAREEWGYTKEDFTLMFLMGVGDNFIAQEETNNRAIGMLSTYDYGNKVAWIGNVVVSEEYRHHGIAESLIKHAVRELRRRGVKTVRLYSKMNTENLYRQLDFVSEGTIGVFTKTIGTRQSARSAGVFPGKGLFQVNETNPEQIFDLDAKCFGADRRKVLSSMVRSRGSLCLAKSNGYARKNLVGYVMAAEGKKEFVVGPWICDPERIEVAEELIDATVSQSKRRRVTVATSLDNAPCTRILEKLKFNKTMEVKKMRKGRNLYNGKPSWIFGVGGLEKG
jgi:ribosomal protein S18 acetylase RimI-like enzyme